MGIGLPLSKYTHCEWCGRKYTDFWEVCDCYYTVQPKAIEVISKYVDSSDKPQKPLYLFLIKANDRIDPNIHSIIASSFNEAKKSWNSRHPDVPLIDDSIEIKLPAKYYFVVERIKLAINSQEQYNKLISLINE